MAVPYIFATTPGGSNIPLSYLDANFAYLTNGSIINPTQFGSIALSGNLSVAGASNFVGLATFNNVTINGTLTIDGSTVNPTGTTGTGLLVFNNSPVLINPTLGTPQSGNLANCTNYPVTQLAGLAPNVLPFLTNPTSGTLALAVTDETGSGSLVFANNPTLNSPIFLNPTLNTPASGNLVNCTNLPSASVVGVMTIGQGGTGLATTGTVGQILGVVAPNTLGYIIQPPASGIAGGAASEVLYQSAPNVTAFVPNGAAGQVLTSNGAAAPYWANANAANLTGVVPIANGGTGQSTQQAAINALVNNVTAGWYLRGSGTNVVLSPIIAGDVPVLNQNTTGTAAGFTSTTQNSQFNSVGIGVAASGTAGQLNTSGNIVCGGTISDANGPVHGLVLTPNITVSGANNTIAGIPAWANKVTITCNGLRGIGNEDWLIQLQAGSIVTSGYAQWAQVPTIRAANGSNGFIIVVGNSTAVLIGQVFLTRCYGNMWICNLSFGWVTGWNYYSVGGGAIALPSALTGVNLYAPSGFLTGTMSVIYE